MANIFMTGANGAFGSLAAKAILAAGHRLAATVRDPEGRNADSARALRAAGATVIDMDVTDDNSVIKGACEAFGALKKIDVLVNVAGVGTHGLSEGFMPDQMLHLFNLNVVGIHRTMRAVLPSMRESGAGLVINISSLLGRLSLPFFGPYSATKFALETLSDTYRAELSQFGVDVVLVEPGGFKTTWIEALVHPADHGRLEQYGDFSKIPEQSMKEVEALLDTKPEQNPDKVAQAIHNLINMPAGTRPHRTIVDFIGMAEPVAHMNETLAQATAGVYRAFGSDALLTLKVN